MTISEELKWSTKLLKNSGITSSRLDSLILLEHATTIDRAKLLAIDDQQLNKKQKKLFNDLVLQRSKRIPITQLINKCEFYGREFYINEFVMSPRPETEKMIDVFLDLLMTNSQLKKLTHIRLADVGSGSGAIGITVKKEVPKISVDLIDIDKRALKVAKINVVLNTIAINVIENNLLSNMDGKYDVILSNLPYVPDTMTINEEARHEPKKALFSGKDGLDAYREFFNIISEMKNKPLLIITEAFSMMHEQLKALALDSGYKNLISDEFIQAFIINDLAKI